MPESDLLWKAVNRDYTSLKGVVWAVGETTTHPTSTSMVRDQPETYLSASTEPAETLIDRSWPCRLLRVRPVGETIDSDEHPHKVGALAYQVVEETAAWQALGPKGRLVAALIERLRGLTGAEADAIAARFAAAGDTAWYAARFAAWDAATALVVRDLLPAHHYRTLTDPIISVLGHPETWPVPAWCDTPKTEETPDV
ncbi:hypothetical protein [Pseudonocardia asaccharolytica]|uniref:Uncharacterized protein n=1 Tax=Pseudonocardia asaccharolytica DSM 44247 = NBRC 16224 TaxID=1123024 RepID=A0A511CYM9_9PSEU|nr:hypothetical protein [Pseudonocardia asaccharolytica]GEL17665.1 hypothetical protein PA7_15020 [Pseudonocardia asaccharolytica DSM 44247 = NBRC 16224]